MTFSLPKITAQDNLVTVLCRHVNNKPKQVAYTFLDVAPALKNTLTYRELYDQAQNVAAHMLKHHQKGERALMLYEKGADFVVAFFACLMSGIIAVPAYPPRKNQSIERLKNVLVDSQASIIITTVNIAQLCESQFSSDPVFAEAQVMVTEALEAFSGPIVLPELTQADLAFLQYSSGSTGVPKGVMISHGNIIHNQLSVAAAFSCDATTSGVSWLPYFHDMGLSGGILQAAFVGCPVYLMSPTWFLQKPIRWLKAISDYRLEVSGGPSFSWDLCIERIRDEELEGIDLSCWKVAFNGAEPIDAHIMKRFTERFAAYGFNPTAHLPCYGMAEATLLISGQGRHIDPTFMSVEKQSFLKNRAVAAQPGEDSMLLVASGRTWIDNELVIVDSKTLKALPDGDIGEIWFRSPSVAKGYWRKPELTEQTFNAFIADTSEGPYLRTGDLGFVMGDEVFVTGREKDLIIIRGRNYYPQDIENVVGNCADTMQANSTAVFTVPVGDGEGIVVVQEVKRTEMRKMDPRQALAAVVNSVAERMALQLHDVVLIKPAKIAKTSSGKIQRRKARQMYLDGEFEPMVTLLQQQQTPTEQPEQRTAAAQDANPDLNLNPNLNRVDLTRRICDKIGQAVGTSAVQIDTDANFFSLGLNSAISVSFMADLSQHVGMALSPTLVYDYPTINQLVGYLLADGDEEKAASQTVLERDIAIIGQACRFPGADDPEAFWQNLGQGRCHISPFPLDRAYGSDVDSGYYRGGYLDDIERFDSEFFSIIGKEARFIDPQHRLVIELADESIRQAGYHPKHLAGSRTGVFIGTGQNDYMLIGLSSEERHSPYFGTGIALCMAANRISYFYDFSGPSMAIDTACSAAMVALHEAVKNLRSGDCEMALVGGVKLIMFSHSNTILRNAQMLSQDGLCHTFDAAANGYVRGEGAGMVLLKPLSKARADNDNILAVIKGTASNQDGKSNGITAPNGLSQQKAINAALKDAGLSGDEVHFVEAHGTGTELGDPIEVGALNATYGKNRDKPLLISSVKANIGHLESASGIAGLLKAVGCLRHQQVPQQIHFNQPNPHIPWAKMAVKVPTENTPVVNEKGTPLYCGISSFGFGGSNTHVILQQGDVANQQPEQQDDGLARILVVSCRQQSALEPNKRRYANHIEQHSHHSLAKLCWQFNQSQADETYRCAMVADSYTSLSEQLNTNMDHIEPISSQKLAFMFTGQGSQYPHMGAQLFEQQPVFKQHMLQCAGLFDQYLNKPLLSVIYPDDQKEQDLINQTGYAQPALFAIEYALAQLWMSFGVRPQLVIGHSIGEYAAACIAGVMSLEDAIKLVAARGRLIQSLSEGGKMLAVWASKEEVEGFVEGDDQVVDFAAINGPSAVVLSGQGENVDHIRRRLAKSNIGTTALSVSHAFHSSLMTPILAQFRQLFEGIELNVPTIDFVSCLTGERVSEVLTTADYWVDHVRQSVLFADGIDQALAEGVTCLLEIGPAAVLSKMARPWLKQFDKLRALSSMAKDSEQQRYLLETLAALYQRGIEVDWAGVMPVAQGLRIPLPAYAYQKKRLWVKVDSTLGGLGTAQASSEQHDEHISEHLYQVQWRAMGLTNVHLTQVEPLYWLLVADDDADGGVGLANQLKQLLEQKGHYCAIIEPGEEFAVTDQTHYAVNPLRAADFSQAFVALKEGWGEPQMVVNCASVSSRISDTTDAATFIDVLTPGCLCALALVQGMVQAQQEGLLTHAPRLCLVTEQAQIFEPGHEGHSGVLHSTMWGLGKVIALEHPDFWCINIDLQPDGDRAAQALQIVTELCSGEPETQVVLDGNERRVARMTRVLEMDLAPRKIRFKPDCHYLITGGLGALALKTARWMVERGACHILLMARRQPEGAALDCIERMHKLGAEVSVVEADVTNLEQVRAVIDSIDQNNLPLAGVFHTAGLLDDMAIRNQSRASFEKVMAPKVLGAWNLHQLTQHLALDHFVMLSSAAALFGSPGQANYAAANTFLDGLAHYRRAKGLSAMSLQLGIISQIGLASERELDAKLDNRGIRPVAPNEYIHALELLMGSECTQVAVVPVKWEKWQDNVRQWSFLADFAGQQGESGASDGPGVVIDPALVNDIQTAQDEQKQPLMLNYLQQLTAAVSETAIDLVDVTVPLTTLGLDSLLVVELQKQIQNDFGLILPVVQLFQSHSLEHLSIDLVDQLAEQAQSTPEVEDDDMFEEGLL